MAINELHAGRLYRVNGHEVRCVGINDEYVIFCYTHDEYKTAYENHDNLAKRNFLLPIGDPSIEEIDV